MRKTKQRKLEAAGWRVGSAAEFLELSPEEAALGVELPAAVLDPKEVHRSADVQLAGAAVGGELAAVGRPGGEQQERDERGV